MLVLNKAIYIEAHPGNFNQSVRPSSAIEYICVHYTGNINDTARNNCIYYRENNKGASAHYYCWEDTVYNSVPENHAAYAVGLGARKEPYFRWPSMWKKITNSNSISVEICGSKNSREGSDKTKDTAARLVSDLLIKYNLTPSRVYRHYDVTGKECPAWAVKDPMKWLEFTLRVNSYYFNGGDDEMMNNEENYKVFQQFMKRYLSERGQQPATWEASAMQDCANTGILTNERPKSFVTRGELASVITRLN